MGGGGGDHGVHGEAADFRMKVWSMTGGPYCRPKHWKRNTAIAMFGIFLVCIPIAMKSAELEASVCIFVAIITQGIGTFFLLGFVELFGQLVFSILLPSAETVQLPSSSGLISISSGSSVILLCSCNALIIQFVQFLRSFGAKTLATRSTSSMQAEYLESFYLAYQRGTV